MNKLILLPLIFIANNVLADNQVQYINSGGMVWMPITFLKNWNGANKYCSTTLISNLTDWRLPSAEELLNLYASTDVANKGWILTNTWSSTHNVQDSHWIVSLDEGKKYPVTDFFLNYVTCVHIK